MERDRSADQTRSRKPSQGRYECTFRLKPASLAALSSHQLNLLNNHCFLPLAMLLSILIPCYNNKTGLMRILKPLTRLKHSTLVQLEVIVGDDSAYSLINHDQYLAIKQSIPFFQYFWNSPSLGAVNNWNYLLSAATGKYSWLCHHDEYLSDADSGIDLLLSTISFDNSDIFILPLLKTFCIGSLKFVQCHTPPRIILRLFTKSTALLFHINPLGPPSVLIVRSSFNANYDQHLKWLVDVEYYYQLFSKPNVKICFVRTPLYIISDQAWAGSITKDLAPHLRSIKIAESHYLELKRLPARKFLYLSFLPRAILFFIKSLSTRFLGATSSLSK